MSSNTLSVQLLTGLGKLPTRADDGAAGYDLYAAYDSTVPPRGRCLVKTDIAVAVPKGTYGRVAPRSGLALKNGIDVGAGVVDYSYRGNVGVILFNHTDQEFKVSVGDRVAQLILERIVDDAVVVRVESLDSTSRGENGFGSSGK